MLANGMEILIGKKLLHQMLIMQLSDVVLETTTQVRMTNIGKQM